MYVKPPRRQLHGTYVPDNYNGTAFAEPQDEQALTDPAPPEPEQEPKQEPISLPASAVTEKSDSPGLLSSLFSGFGGVRSDDLLLLALILLLSRSGDGNKNASSDVLPLLALLLFMG